MLPVEVNDSTLRGTVEKSAVLDTTRFAVVKFAFDTMFSAIKLPVNDKFTNPVVMFDGRSTNTDCEALVNDTADNVSAVFRPKSSDEDCTVTHANLFVITTLPVG